MAENVNANTNSSSNDRGLRAMFNDGCIAQQYSQKFFVKVRPSLNIDKIRFSFVPIGTGAVGHFDIYMDTTVFDNWCEDILAYRMSKKILAEFESLSKDKNFKNYYYTYKTGDNGSKVIRFTPSSKYRGQIVVSGSIVENGQRKSIALLVDYSWLRSMAMIYKRVSDKYWDGVATTILEANARNRQQNGTMPVKENPNVPVVENVVPVIDDVVNNDSYSAGLDISNDDLPF